MASIYVRENKDGTKTYRVVVRRKNIPTLCLSFTNLLQAENWVRKHEQKYIENPYPYLIYIEKNRLNLKRKREFENQYEKKPWLGTC